MCDPVPDANLVSCLKCVTNCKNLKELARGVARVQGQPIGRNQRRKRANTLTEVRTGGFWTSTPPFAHAGPSFDVLRLKVGRIAPGAKSCEDTRSTTELSNRSWNVPQICAAKRAPSGRRRRNRWSPGCVFERLLCPGIPASPWFTASCCRDGSLAVILLLWDQKTPEVIDV